MVATVLPLNSGLRKATAKPLTASAAVFIHHPPPVDEGLVAKLSTAFRLTGAEARVMASLLEGLQISEIAQRYGVSANTVRTQLQRLFEKTNTKRQSDLVRVVSTTLPPIRLDGGSSRSSQRPRRQHARSSMKIDAPAGAKHDPHPEERAQHASRRVWPGPSPQSSFETPAFAPSGYGRLLRMRQNSRMVRKTKPASA